MTKDFFARQKRLHIVQISYDASVFSGDQHAESVRRQVEYGRELARERPDSRLSLLVLTPDRSAEPFEIENVVFTPVTGGKLLRRAKVYFELRLLNKEQPIDVITTQSVFDEAWLVLLFAVLNGARVVGQIHYDIFSTYAPPAHGRGMIGRIRFMVGLKLLKRFFALRVVGRRIEQRILEKRLHHNVHVIPVPVDMLRDKTKEYYLGSRLPRVLFVGRLDPQKNLVEWLKIASVIGAGNEEVVFDIVGDGVLRQELEDVAKELGIESRVRFHGFVPYEKLYSVYRRSKVFLLTSHYEGFGRVLVESYANRVPVVAFRIAGVEDIVVHGGTGFLHVQGDIAGMAQSVAQLLQEDTLASEMGALGEKTVRKRFDPDKLTKRWVALLCSSARKSIPWMLPLNKRTWKRWKHIGLSPLTLLRSLEYEAIAGLVLRGKTLDVGGGFENSYYHLLHLSGTIYSVNIDPNIQPTVIADLNENLPFMSSSYDNVISFNTFEHIFKDKVAIRESLRVLKPGGQFHFIAPFLYQVHGSPIDYHRHTLHWWIQFMIENGADPGTFQIEPLVWDRLSSAYSLIGHGPVGRIIKVFVTAVPMVKDIFFGKGEYLRDTRANKAMLNLALGYYIRGTKRGWVQPR